MCHVKRSRLAVLRRFFVCFSDKWELTILECPKYLQKEVVLTFQQVFEYKIPVPEIINPRKGCQILINTFPKVQCQNV